MTNLAKTTHQASDRHKNDKCLTGTRDGVPTNLTKVTRKANLAKIANLSSNSSKKQFLKTKKEMGPHKYKQNAKTTNLAEHQIKQATDTKMKIVQDGEGKRSPEI